MVIEAIDGETRIALLGGATLDGPRYLWSTLVASDKECIEEATAYWTAQQFAPVPRETKFTPLPQARPTSNT